MMCAMPGVILVRVSQTGRRDVSAPRKFRRFIGGPVLVG